MTFKVGYEGTVSRSPFLGCMKKYRCAILREISNEEGKNA